MTSEACACHGDLVTQAHDRAERGEAGTRGGRRRWATRRIISLLLAVAIVVFVVENTARVPIRVLLPVVTMPLWLALIGTTAVALLIGWLAADRKLLGHNAQTLATRTVEAGRPEPGVLPVPSRGSGAR